MVYLSGKAASVIPDNAQCYEQAYIQQTAPRVIDFTQSGD